MTAEVVSHHWPMNRVRRSDELTDFWAAFIALQADLKPIPKSETNEYSKYSYASIDDLIRIVRPILKEHGFGFTQHVTSGDGAGIVLTTFLVHESGQWISSEVPVPSVQVTATNAAQQLGAGITYFRRYALSAILGLSLEEDTDAAQLTDNGSNRVQQAQRAANQHNRQQAPPQQSQKKKQAAGDADGQKAYFLADRIIVDKASNGKVYQKFANADGKQAAWWPGRKELMEEIPWLAEIASIPELHQVGTVFDIPETKVSGVVKNGYLDITGFEKVGDMPPESSKIWKNWRMWVADAKMHKVRYPELTPQTNRGILIKATEYLQKAVSGVAKGRSLEKAQDWLNGKMEELFPDTPIEALLAPEPEPEPEPEDDGPGMPMPPDAPYVEQDDIPF